MDVKTLCLAALSLGDSSGYEIKKMFEEGPFSHFYDASFGSIYPALNKLLEEGQVTCVAMAQESRPAKKVYSLTEDGREKLREDLHQMPAQDKYRSESVVMMFFAHLLDDEQKGLAYDKILSHYQEGLQRIQELDLSDQPYGRQFVHGLGLTIYSSIVDYLTTHKDKLIQETETGRNKSATVQDALEPRIGESP